jgi:hypothetical protein
MKKLSLLFSFAFLALTSLTLSQTTISQWSFETQAVIAPLTSVSLSISPATDDASDAGTVVSGVHAATGTVWSKPAGNFSVYSLSGNNWTVGDYFQFQFPTSNFHGISITWDHNGSATGPRDFDVAYSTDGSSFTTATSISLTSGLTWKTGGPSVGTNCSLDLSAVSGLNDQAAVYIRIVDKTTTAINAGTVGTGGTSRVDNFIAKGFPDVTPVELSSFTSNVNGRNVSLAWVTKTEKNSNKFDIERNSNGVWASIGSVKAAVLSNSPKQYSFLDKNLNAGVYQYRLKMIDNDGSFKYSSVTEATVSTPKNFELLQNYPNPFNPSTKINYNLPSDAKVTLDVYNVLGVKVGQLVNQDQSAGYYSVDFNTSSLSKSISSGVYLYKITSVDKVTGNSFSAIKKMMMLK